MTEASKSIGIAQWTKDAGPWDSCIVTGFGFTEKTVFKLGTSDGNTRNAVIRHVEPYQAAISLPESLPNGEMYLLWAVNGKEASEPVRINAPEVWWVNPLKAELGQQAAVFGRNLAIRNKVMTSHVYLKSVEDEQGVWAKAVEANPYKVEILVPEDFKTGMVEVWVHNGQGGKLGWGALHDGNGGSPGVAKRHLEIVPKWEWNGPTFNVTSFGATPNDNKDDTQAILAALRKANATPRSTVYFPAGFFYSSETLRLVGTDSVGGVRLLGEGKDQTFVKLNRESNTSTLLFLTGKHHEVRKICFATDDLDEDQKYYTGADRGEWDPAYYTRLWQKVLDRREVEAAKRKAELAEEKRKEAERVKKLSKPVEFSVDKKRAKDPEDDLLADLLGEPKPKPAPVIKKPKPQPKPAPKKRKSRILVRLDGHKANQIKLIDCIFDSERNISMRMGSSEVLMQNCDIVGTECQIGTLKNSRIDNCHFYGRADTGVMMYSYGSWCLAVTNCTGQDYLPNSYDTAQGRFFTISGYGNRTANVYIGGCETKDLTIRPTHYNQNSGEQIMWEFTNAIDKDTPLDATATTFRFNKSIPNNKISWYSTAMITTGKGVGQYRQIAKYDPATKSFELYRPWKVITDESSVITIARTGERFVVYGNQLDAKSWAATHDEHIASAGVEPFGSSAELIVDSNTFNELRTGIVSFGLTEENGVSAPTLFNFFANNRFEKVRYGIRHGAGADATTGCVTRNNSFTGVILDAYKWGGNGSDLNLMEQNSFTNTWRPVMLASNNRNTFLEDSHVVLNNTIQLGEADKPDSIGIIRGKDRNVIQVNNQVSGFEKTEVIKDETTFFPRR